MATSLSPSLSLNSLPFPPGFLETLLSRGWERCLGQARLLERLSSICSSYSSYSYYYYYKFLPLSISLPFLPYNNSHQICLEVSNILLAIERNTRNPIFALCNPLLVLIHLNHLLFALERNLLFVRVRNPMFASNKCFVKLERGGGGAICQHL